VHMQGQLCSSRCERITATVMNFKVYLGTYVTRLAMKLIALIFARTSELINVRWKEFDLEARRLDIPSEQMKMRTPHIVTLAR
jgi:integrase